VLTFSQELQRKRLEKVNPHVAKAAAAESCMMLQVISLGENPGRWEFSKQGIMGMEWG